MDWEQEQRGAVDCVIVSVGGLVGGEHGGGEDWGFHWKARDVAGRGVEVWLL
jgi:hypothetical protein